jgi:hypothetical protein
MPTKWIKITTVVVVAVVAAGIAFVAGHRSVDKPKPAASNQTTGPTSAQATGGLVEFRDEKNGFAVSYPRNWLRLQSTDPSVVLVVSEKPPQQNTGGSILARTITLANPVGPDQLAEAKKVTDEIVTKGPGVELKFEPKAITQGGLPGWLYLYTFADTASGQRGVHSHYFLFKDRTMISLVFQALPESEFTRLAPVFDDVIATFRVL